MILMPELGGTESSRCSCTIVWLGTRMTQLAEGWELTTREREKERERERESTDDMVPLKNVIQELCSETKISLQPSLSDTHAFSRQYKTISIVAHSTSTVAGDGKS